MSVRALILASAVACAAYSAITLATLGRLVFGAPGYWQTLALTARAMLAFQLALAVFEAVTALGIFRHAWWARIFIFTLSAMSIFTGVASLVVFGILGHASMQILVFPGLYAVIGVSWLALFNTRAARLWFTPAQPAG